MRDKLRNFMAGRNGLDALGCASLLLSLLFNLIGSLTEKGVFALVSAVILALTLWRMFSRDLERRRAENAKFAGFFSRLRQDFAAFRVRFSQSRDYRFFTCPGCRNRLRVPRGKGHIQITCPRCGHRFSGKT